MNTNLSRALALSAAVIAPGTIADILVVDDNPLANTLLLADHGEHLLAITKDGRFHENRLSSSSEAT